VPALRPGALARRHLATPGWKRLPYGVSCLGLIALALLPIGFEAHPISRYTSTSMTCTSIKS